jgi:hypothetical protein
MSDLKKIAFTPYRGKLEPVTKIIIAEITLHTKHLEAALAYEYTERVKENEISFVDKPNFTKVQVVYPKHLMHVTRSVAVHEEDTLDKEECQLVQLYCGQDCLWVRCKDDKEAKNVYNTIKNWLLS